MDVISEENIPVVSKQVIGEHLYFLNRAIKDLQEQQKADGYDPQRRQKIKELYLLKENVIAKLLEEGHIAARRPEGAGLYSFRLNKVFSFHVVQTKIIRGAIKQYGRKKFAKSALKPSENP